MKFTLQHRIANLIVKHQHSENHQKCHIGETRKQRSILREIYFQVNKKKRSLLKNNIFDCVGKESFDEPHTKDLTNLKTTIRMV